MISLVGLLPVPGRVPVRIEAPGVVLGQSGSDHEALASFLERAEVAGDRALDLGEDRTEEVVSPRVVRTLLVDSVTVPFDHVGA